MTAHSDFKRRVRQRMQRTGESYTAARRHFLRQEDLKMTQGKTPPVHELPIDALHFTVKTKRTLKARGIERVGELLDENSGYESLGLSRERALEIREVLASRGY